MNSQTQSNTGTPANPDGPVRVLVADDEEAIRGILSEYLGRQGYQVSLAEDGLAALEMFRESRFDLVLSDVKMPRLSGLELLDAIKDISALTPVIMISGYSEAETIVSALKAGAENFLTKPLSMQTLAKVIRQSLEMTSQVPSEMAGFIHLDQTILLESPSRPEMIFKIIGLLSLAAAGCGFCRGGLNNNIKLALSEALTNAMEHGNQWDPQKIVRMEAKVTPNEMQTWITDQGEGFALEALPDPTDPDRLLSERGRGVFLMHTIMDEVSYLQGGRQIYLKKRKEAEPAPPESAR